VDLEAVKAVLSEYRALNADVYFGDDYDIDDLVDVVEGGRVYIPALYVVNKIDQISLEELEVMDRLVSCGGGGVVAGAPPFFSLCGAAPTTTPPPPSHPPFLFPPSPNKHKNSPTTSPCAPTSSGTWTASSR